MIMIDWQQNWVKKKGSDNNTDKDSNNYNDNDLNGIIETRFLHTIISKVCITYQWPQSI